MKSKILKKLLIIVLIMMLTATDFFMLGSGIVSYANSLDNSTNNENIEFTAYFKDSNGERVDKTVKSIKNENLKLFAEIKVKNEGYLNGSIEIVNGNFNIKNNILSNAIVGIENNKVNLNQINAGETVEIELDIEPIISETLTINMLAKDTTVKLTGTYMETTYEGLNIEASKIVNLNLQVDETMNAELATEIITNKVFSINGTNKRIVQLILKSRLKENDYPIKQTVLNINVPQLGEKTPEDVKVLSLGTQATNGSTDSTIENWKNENGIVGITINNDANENNEISWEKDVYDELIVTFVYPEDADASKVEITTNSEIAVYNSESKFTASHLVGIENKELNNIITTQKEVLTTDVYKGQLYENAKNIEKVEIPFSTTTSVEIKNKDIADKITIKEEKDVFTTNTTDIVANTKFISTEISKAKMLEILGQNGSIQIKSGETIQTITKDTAANDSGNIVINYTDTVSELEIIISEPEQEGILEIKHNKSITGDTNTVEIVKTIKALKIKNTIIASLGEANVVENSTETTMELKETISKAELILNKEGLSTITENKDFILGVKLNTANKMYDLYKNPKINIQLPMSVENITLNSFDKLYGDEFTIENAIYNKESKTIEISLIGEQLKYAESEATQLYIQINFNVTLSKMEPAKTDKITMQYINENASLYEGNTTDAGYIEKTVNISSPSGLVTINSETVSGAQGISGITDKEQIININKKTDGAKELTYKIGLVNNTNSILNNVVVLGNFPTDGEFAIGEENFKNTLITTLKGAINAQNCTIYYSDNVNATEDVANTNNGWKSNINEVANPKVYLIVINQMDVMANFEATYKVQLPVTLDYELQSHTGYKVSYTEANTGITQSTYSTVIGLSTGEGIKLSTTVSATVGNDELKDGDTVKAGEVIKYKVTVKNNGTHTLENVVVKGQVPEGTVIVVPEEGFEYTGVTYYIEKPEITEMSETIALLNAGQEYSFEYEVRVKMDVTNGTQISNKSIVTCNEYEIQSNEIKNTLSETKMRITIKRLDDIGEKSAPNSAIQYKVFVENMSNEAIKNLKVQMFNTNSEIRQFYYFGQTDVIKENKDKTISISEIAVNDAAWFDVIVWIDKQTENSSREIEFTSILTDSEGNTYRANKDIQQLYTLGVKVDITSTPDNGSYVNMEDEIEYVITAENTGDIGTSFTIKDVIPEQLEITEIYENDELLFQTIDISDEDTYAMSISNDYKHLVYLEPGQKIEVSIIAYVKEIEENFELKTISNSATAFATIDSDINVKTSEIVHMIQGNINEETKHMINGIAWFDANENGQKDPDEQLLSDIAVKLFDISTNTIALDKEGNLAETVTNDEGEYTFSKIKEGKYIVIFEYDTTEYEPTAYLKEGVAESLNSNVVLKNIIIDGEEKAYAATDTIDLTESIANINIGLKEIKIFDLQLDKYINRIVVQNSKGTNAYDYENSTFEKIEIHSKQLKNTLVVLEYSIKVKNNGEVAGYINNIVDYLPEGLTFSSELNPDWYLSENNLYNKSLANEKINPGEEKEVKLILTKTMTSDNVGLVNNRAELYETYNEYGLKDINSTENNQAKDENDLGSADVIITVATGATTFIYTFLIILNTGLIALAIYLVIKNSKRRIRREGR